MSMAGSTGPERIVTALVGDETILCAVAATDQRISIVVNAHYAHALAHAERHLCTQPDGAVWICSPICPGPG